MPKRKRYPPEEWWRQRVTPQTFQQLGWYASPKQQKGRKKQEEWWQQFVAQTGVEPSSFSQAYYGTAAQREAYGIEPIRAGTEVPAGVQQYLSTDPYAALGMWQNIPTQQEWVSPGQQPSAKEMAYRLMFARGQYLPYLEQYKAEKEAGPAPEMFSSEWFKQESRDLKQMMQEQGYAAEAAELTPERPPAMSWWQRALTGLQAGQSAVIGFIAGLPSDQEKFEKVAEYIRSLPGGRITSPEQAKRARELWETTLDTGSMAKAWEQMKTGFGGAVKGRMEDVWTGTRFLKGAGLRGEDWPSKILRGTAGFAIDILADPLTYLTAAISGTTKAGKAARGARAGQEFLEEIGEEMIEAGGKAASAVQKLTQPAVKKATTKAVSQLKKVMPEEQIGALVKQVDAGDIAEMIGKGGLAYHPKSIQALVGHRRILGLTGKPAQKIYEIGEAFQRGLGKIFPRARAAFHDVGQAVNLLGTPLEPAYHQLKALTVAKRNITGLKRVLAGKVTKELTGGLPEESLRRIRDVLEIVPAGVLEEAGLRTKVVSNLTEGGGEWLEKLQKIKVLPESVEEMRDWLTRRGISKGERKILGEATGEELERAGAIAKILKKTKEEEIGLGLLTKEHPAYLPHITKRPGTKGHPLYKYSQHLGFQERAEPFTTIRRLEAVARKKGVEPFVETDLPTILQRRLAASARAVPAARFQLGVMQLKDELGEPLVRGAMTDEEAIARGYVQMTGIVGGPMAGKYAPKEIADEMTKFSNALASGMKTGTIQRAYDKSLNAWKFMATSFRVGGFNLRNHYSNLWLRYIGGANPAKLGHYTRKAIAIQMAASEGPVRKAVGQKVGKIRGLPNTTVKLATGEVLDAEEVMELARYLGMHKVGLMGGVQEPIAKGGARFMGEEPWEGATQYGGKLRAVGKPFRETSEFVERTDRIAFFIEQLEKLIPPLP